MAASKKAAAAKVGGLAAAAKENEALLRLLEDEELRDNLRTAAVTAKSAYGRLNNGKGPARALVEDKKLQRELRETADALRDVGAALKEGPKRKKKGFGVGKLLLVTVVGGVAAVALSEGLRKKVLDLLFGAEEEFDYTSTTAPASTPATPAASS